MKKMTRKLRKWLLMTSVALLVMALSVGATLAYLTDTDSVVNTFTVGNVQIELNETDVDNDNSTKQNDYHLVPNQTYTKDPTVTIKANSEPSYVRMFVTVEDYADLEAVCYAHEFGAQEFEYFYSADGENWYVLLEKFTTGASADWECVGMEIDEGDSYDYCHGIYEFRYQGTTQKQEADYELDPLFKEIQVPGWMTNDMLKALSEGYMVAQNGPHWVEVAEVDSRSAMYGRPFAIKVEAQAIQAAGFADADAAWAAFDAKHASN